ncbi:putative SPARK domain-containing protein [Helianthus anomalus]
MKISSFHYLIIIFILSFLFNLSRSGLLTEPAQPLKPPDDSPPNTVPSFPVQTESELCRLDLSAELFGGVNAACGRNLDRSRCCPVLAAWLFAAHARSALQVNASAPPATDEMPMMPDDSQNCVNSLQNSLQSRNIHLPQPNASCDAVLCFCGIRLHQIGSLSCPAAFNVTKSSRNAIPTVAVRNLEKSCRNSSYAGCTRCLEALQKLNDDGQNGTRKTHHQVDDRASKIMTRDCQLMGLTWLLARNKTAYIPTVSAVLRAIMYSAHPPHEFKCSPDQENMPLAVDSLQFEKSSGASLARAGVIVIVMTLLPLVLEFV